MSPRARPCTSFRCRSRVMPCIPSSALFTFSARRKPSEPASVKRKPLPEHAHDQQKDQQANPETGQAADGPPKFHLTLVGLVFRVGKAFTLKKGIVAGHL